MYKTGERVRIFNVSETNYLYDKTGTLLNDELDDMIIILLDEPINNNKAVVITKYSVELI